MDTAKTWSRLSVEEYLDGEKDAAVKHEYVHGETFAMAGASDVHNTVALNIALALTPAARRSNCRVYASDMKVRVTDAIFYYPDVMFVCEDGPDAYYKDKPCAVVEVISQSTARTDENEKRHAYLGMQELELYLLVDSRRRFARGFYRTKTGWEERFFMDEDSLVPIPCAGVSLSMEDIYVQTPWL
jgi:Uma2 family endonuclease